MKYALTASTASTALATKLSFVERILPFLFDNDDPPADPPSDDPPADPPSDDPPAPDQLTPEQIEELRQRAEAADAAAAEVERLRKEQEKFKGIDPAQARANAEKVAQAEAAARQAEKEKAEAEGNLERLREIQNEEHEAAIREEREKREAAEQRSAALEARMDRAARTSACANSRYLSSETILSGPKAERIYGDYVEIEDGEGVVYDAPEGAKKRAKGMDGRGNPLPFDEAIKKVIEADPDKDSFVRSKLKPGANSKTETSGKPEKGASRHSRLVAGLKALKGE